MRSLLGIISSSGLISDRSSSNHIVETNAAYNILDDCQDINMPPNHGDVHTSGKDTTSDSSRTSVYPAPTYHFHGLGNTQTQSESQVNNDFYDFNDGSQKENINAPEAIVEPKIAFIQASSPVPTSVNGIEARGTKGSYVDSPLEMTKVRIQSDDSSPFLTTPLCTDKGRHLQVPSRCHYFKPCHAKPTLTSTHCTDNVPLCFNSVSS